MIPSHLPLVIPSHLLRYHPVDSRFLSRISGGFINASETGIPGETSPSIPLPNLPRQFWLKRLYRDFGFNDYPSTDLEVHYLRLLLNALRNHCSIGALDFSEQIRLCLEHSPERVESLIELANEPGGDADPRNINGEIRDSCLISERRWRRDYLRHLTSELIRRNRLDLLEKLTLLDSALFLEEASRNGHLGLVRLLITGQKTDRAIKRVIQGVIQGNDNLRGDNDWERGILTLLLNQNQHDSLAQAIQVAAEKRPDLLPLLLDQSPWVSLNNSSLVDLAQTSVYLPDILRGSAMGARRLLWDLLRLAPTKINPYPAFEGAVIRDDTDLFRKLLNQLSLTRDEGKRLTELAVRKGKIRVFNLLVKQFKLQPTEYLQSTLTSKPKFGHALILESIIEGANLNLAKLLETWLRSPFNRTQLRLLELRFKLGQGTFGLNPQLAQRLISHLVKQGCYPEVSRLATQLMCVDSNSSLCSLYRERSGTGPSEGYWGLLWILEQQGRLTEVWR